MSIASEITEHTSGFSFKVGIGTQVADPGDSINYAGNVASAAGPINLTRTLVLSPGNHTVHLIAFNASGGNTFTDARLTLIAVGQE